MALTSAKHFKYFKKISSFKIYFNVLRLLPKLLWGERHDENASNCYGGG